MVLFPGVRRRSAVVATAVAAVVGSLIAFPSAPASAVSPDVVISQVHGGGGNSGAPYTHDYIELYNRGTTTASLSGWSVQYASATGSSWQVTALSGSIAPGRYYLIREGAGSGAGQALPAPDASGSIAMSATSGKVALRTTTTALTCSTGCATQSGVRDFTGYGSGVSSYEGAGPAPTLSNSTAALRGAAGQTDTDHNAADFAAGSPAPRNSAFTGGGSGSGTRIRDIQGRAHRSPLNGQQVQAVPGVVTAVTTNGFWMQDPSPDADPATGEGLFVHTGSAPGRQAGDSVTVTGTVAEYRPGGTGGTDNLTTTQLTSPTVTLVSAGAALPAATLVGTGGRVPPAKVVDNDATGDVETSGTFDATTDGIDFWESMEGMRVRLDNAPVVGPRNDFGEIPVVPAGSTTRTARGGIAVQADDFNPERIIVDDVLAATPAAHTGDTLSGSVTGVLDYSFGNFKLLPGASPVVADGGVAPETTQAAAADELSVATFNVENLDPGDPQAKFDALADAIVTNLRSPDLIALEEIQDNDGATDSGTVAADQTLAELVAAISAAGGPSYTWRQIDPADDADGGEAGGNIRVAFLYRTDRGLSFTDRAGGTATAATTVSSVGGQPQLSFSPGRVDPQNSAFASSRKPLAGEFTWNGERIFVIANHFNSKGGDDPLFGRTQPPVRSTETQRHQQATVVRDFVDDIRAVDPDAAIVVLGDLNDFEFSATTDILTAGGALTDLPATLPAAERYTYVFEGNSQVLDHILLSPSLAATSYAYDVVHVNSEFAAQISDHDPQVVRLPLP
ncbi:lamin tail domain-containing protein [Streptomyces specialis]|uniref:lamin tail domain-containing protein n=1 Tax=Streptomyces specialis TaxID=498367 RepID=UPI00073E851A|nr:lamin tail domain-containing protein [Streptomyces specialis]